MTAQTPTYLKGRFEQGDIPQGSDYEDLIDSFVNLQISAIQTMVGGLVSTNFIYGAEVNSALVSASSGIFSFVSAQTLNAAFVSAGDVYIGGSLFQYSLDVSAETTTQAGAFTVNGINNFVIYANGNNTALKLPASVRGREQRIINAASTTLKIFPAVSGRFLVTAVNASLNLPADRTALIIHKGDDRYSFMVG